LKASWSRAAISSLIGFPMAYIINLSILPGLQEIVIENVYLAAFLLAIPFMIFSTLRIFFIDTVWKKIKN